ncbi:DUF2860 domain-containing protein [Psychromonas ossibalaenae]|uniref:DUF2860 domain-containing protein n=1 Tax=Psychromonas ossibalaenae TaxID=444922 RepID=UPI00036CEF6D|nr:DUF2860 domain-containing protein [Psychromonas ossibalaenae]
MNKVFKILILSLFLSSQAWSRPLAKESGWAFTLNVNAGTTTRQSQFNTHEDNEINKDSSSSGESVQTAIIYPLARIQYTFDSLKTQMFLGNSKDQVATARFQYELGVAHQFRDNSRLTLAFFPELTSYNETWQDPFLENSTRKTTRENTRGGRAKLERIGGGPLTVQYAFAASKADQENSGQSQSGLTAEEISSLVRDSQYHRIELQTTLPLRAGVLLRPSVQYTIRNAKGEANSYDQYHVQLTLLLLGDKHNLITTLNAGTKKFSEINPVFDHKQDSVSAGIFSVYTYKKPFNWKSINFNVMAGYNQENSDIDFYDSSGLIVSTGFTYQF